jgi:OOP family OmpA-OmpF porin
MLKSSFILSGLLAFMLLLPAAKTYAESHPVAVQGYEWKRLDYNYFKTLSPEEQLRLRIYREYEQREPCQNYRKLPADLVFHDCKLFHRVALPAPTPAPVPVIVQPAPAPAPKVLSSYEVFFALDSTALTLQSESMLDKAAADISQYNPSSVVVAGYTDTSGSAAYNETLSAKRAAAVSAGLTKRGVENTVLNQEAHGQNDLKVPTPDNVREPQNRRTVIHFMK